MFKLCVGVKNWKSEGLWQKEALYFEQYFFREMRHRSEIVSDILSQNRKKGLTGRCC